MPVGHHVPHAIGDDVVDVAVLAIQDGLAGEVGRRRPGALLQGLEGMAGATITGNGVSAMISESLNLYKDYLESLSTN